jgi:hypothetical protein
MRYFNKERDLFYIHIHKCGGTSIIETLGLDSISDKMIEERLNDPLLKRHFDGTKSYYYNGSVYDIMSDYFGDEFQNGLVISSIRDPYARFISFFNYFRANPMFFRTPVEKLNDFIQYFMYFRKIEENERIEEAKSNWTHPRIFTTPGRQDKYLTRHVVSYHGDPYTQHLSDKNGNPKPDFIFILEDMTNSQDKFNELHGSKITFKHLNKTGSFSNNKDYLKFYDDKSYDFVTNFYKKDIEFYKKMTE